MNYRQWVRDELRGFSKSLGFRYTPFKEIQGRISRLKTAMEDQDIEALLVVQKMDLYYLSGTTQDSVLFIPNLRLRTWLGLLLFESFQPSYKGVAEGSLTVLVWNSTCSLCGIT